MLVEFVEKGGLDFIEDCLFFLEKVYKRWDSLHSF